MAKFRILWRGQIVYELDLLMYYTRLCICAITLKRKLIAWSRSQCSSSNMPDCDVWVLLELNYFSWKLLNMQPLLHQPSAVRETVNKAVLSQGNRAMPQLFFSVLSSPTTFTTSLRVAKLRKPGFRAPNIPVQNNLTQNGHSGSFKVACFGVCGKAIRDYVILYNNVGLIC